MLLIWIVCSSLKSINLSSFNTINVTNMIRMFDECSSLKSIDLSSFNTNNVTDMSYMFRKCSSLKKENVKINKNENIIEELSSDWLSYILKFWNNKIKNLIL